MRIRQSVFVAMFGVLGLVTACVDDENAGKCTGETCAPTLASPLDVHVPSSLASTKASSSLTLTLTFGARADYDSASYLGVVFTKASASDVPCADIWANPIRPPAAARLNLVAFPPNGAVTLYAPEEGDMAMYVYTFAALPTLFCRDSADCAKGSVGADAGPGGECSASTAGLGVCGDITQYLPTAAGCATLAIKNQGTVKTEVTLTSRPQT